MSLDVINKALAPVKKQMRLMVNRCVLSSTEERGLLTSQVEALEGETIDGAERLENYGLAGRPPAGSEGAMLAVGGARDHPVILGLEHRGHRPEIAEGEVQIYSLFKQMIHLDKDGNIIIKAPKGVIIEAESFTATLTRGVAFKSQSFESQAREGVKFDSRDFWADAQSDIAFTGQHFGVAAAEGSEVDGGVHFTREVATDRTLDARGDITSQSRMTALGDITSRAEVRDKRSTMQDMRGIYNSHTHPQVGPTTEKM